MTDKEISKAAAEFAERWKGRGYEKGESQLFWADLLTNVYGVRNLPAFIRYEEQVASMVESTNFIDGHIPSMKVLIEQKSINKDLRAPIKQSSGIMLTPFQQAKQYVANMPRSEHPKWIVTCNFAEFLVYDMERPNGEPEQIFLKDLGKEYYRLKFLVDGKSEHISKEMEVSIHAGVIVGRIYDALLKQYDDNSTEALRWLNILCVRIVFCLYAEDAGIFGRDQFHDYLVGYEAKDMRNALIRLFEVLNTPTERRSRYLMDDLKAFPYTNGGLFATEIEIPQFTDELRHILLYNASLDFDWSAISPTIFGAVFESTLNPETRRAGGMHYTSIENIHKVIDALFLNALRKEFETILEEKVERTRNRLLDAFQDKLASLVFLDPACGSGNFLTETYLSLRRLENEVIRARYHGQTMMGAFLNPIKVSISQFYGIEINDFAVTVATTALWISEAQMLAETEKIITFEDDFLPLKTYANITEGNALRIEWESVVPKDKLSYIIGNPPFVGHQWRSEKQQEDMHLVFVDAKKHGKLDYVACWYKKAADLMQNTHIRCAFVSTNSITQGESVAALWEFLFRQLGVEIQFAYRTFNWTSEASLKAAVHCVIIGYTCYQTKEKKQLYDGERLSYVDHINGYLIGAPDIFIQSRGKPLNNNLPIMSKGSQPTDGGNLILSPEERENLIREYPESAAFIKRYMGSDEFINNKYRYCLWLKGVVPTEYRKINPIMARLQKVAEVRAKSPTSSVRRDAEIPMLFTQIRQPDSNYLAVPEVSSQRRRYIPIGYMSPDIISSSKLILIPDASIYMFGVMTSNVHMAWMRVVCGRLKSDYSYSPAIYNNFPWPSPTEAQKAKIEQTAQAILDARALFPDASLADLYDELSMPPELRKAHQANDRAVMEAYDFKVSKDFTESICVAELFKLYQELTK